jgi:hypothetical protein
VGDGWKWKQRCRFEEPRSVTMLRIVPLSPEGEDTDKEPSPDSAAPSHPLPIGIGRGSREG